MLKPEELRIGNYVSDNDASDRFFAKVKKLDYSRCYYGQFHSAYSDLKPIQLDEEWLLKLGWIKHHHFLSKTWGENGVEIIVFSKVYEKYEYQLGKGRYRVLESVHQLQNLFYSLSGKELKVIG